MIRRESASKVFNETEPAIDSLVEPSQDEQSDSYGKLGVNVATSISKYHHKQLVESGSSQSLERA